jgi:3-dehydroquinate synthase
MSESFKVNSKLGSYAISFVEHSHQREHLNGEEVFIIIDEKVFDLYPFFKNSKIIKVPALESSKTLFFAESVVKRLRDFGANRNSQIIAIGGGIIQDIATFVASIYMRGISWEYYPTTLLSMVDSCIGGKSSINIADFKNIAGNFYPPKNIYIDSSFCSSLESIDLASGIFEAVKICFADESSSFNTIINVFQDEDFFSIQKLSEITFLSLQAKKRFIEIDEFDNGVRLNLNFGHTFGHAIESASNYAIPHGIAVGIGMQLAIEFSSLRIKSIKDNSRCLILYQFISSILNKFILTLDQLKKIDSDVLFNKFSSDKKHTSKDYVLIIPNQDGYLYKEYFKKDDRFKNDFYHAFKQVLEQYEI